MKKIKELFSQYWPFIIIVFFCLWAIMPLFVRGFFPIHDDEQIGRLFEMNTVIVQGQIPPRWVPDLGFGFGYPLFNFYPPFVYYLGMMGHLIGFSFINATKVVMGLGFILSAFFMYLWSKNRLGILAGLFTAFLYTYLPYHAVDAYVRGALSEFFSFVFIPALFWSLDRLAKNQTKNNFLLASVFLCCIVLTHTLVTLQLIPFFFLYMIYLLFENKKSWRQVVLAFAGISMLGIGLSAYFVIPSFFEKQYTLVDSILIRELANYAIHFVCPMQFWNSPWGYGGSIAGCMDGLSFQIGKIHALLVGLSLVIGLSGVFYSKLKREYSFALFIILLFLFSLFMTTDYSKWIWDTVQPLAYIQFPWRFLLFAGLFSSFLGGFVVSQVAKRFNRKLALLVVILLSAVNFYLVRNDFKPQIHLFLGDDHYLENNGITWYVSRLSYEYVPKQVATRLSPLGTTELAINKSDIPQNPFSMLNGKAVIEVTKNTAVEKNATIIATGASFLQVNTYSFPGWKVFLDGKQTTYQDNNKLHLIQIHIPSGKHTLSIVFTNTPIRSIANGITVISIVVFLLILFRQDFGILAIIKRRYER